MGTKGVGSHKQVKGVLNLEHPRGKISLPEICRLGAKFIFNLFSLPISDSSLQQRARRSLLPLHALTSPGSVTNAEWKVSIRSNLQGANLGFTICRLTGVL